MASVPCPISLRLKLDDQIPFVDAEESCDGSISSEGTGSIFGHSSTEEEALSEKMNDILSEEWRNRGNSLFLGDQHSLNNILDTVSAQNRSIDLDLLSVDNSCLKSTGGSLSAESEGPKLESQSQVSSRAGEKVFAENNNTSSVGRPDTLDLHKDLKNMQFVTLTSAYVALSEQINDQSPYESLYGGSIYGSVTPTSSKVTTTTSNSSLTQYTSSLRSSMRNSLTPDRDPSVRLKNSLRSRYKCLAESPVSINWCPDFQPHISQIVFSLAVDSSWEKGGKNHRLGLSMRSIPFRALLADDRRSSGKKVAGQRILLMGETGYGKTTLVLRLLYDWSSQEMNGYVAHLKYVFCLPCRDYFVHKNIFGLPKDELELAVSAVTEAESKTLFILDGLDELPSEWPSEIVDLLEGKIFTNSLVLATSRPVPPVISNSSFTKRILIRGFEFNHIDSFIRTYFGVGTDGYESMTALLHSNSRLSKLASNPLMCILLCLVFEHESGYLPESLADLFNLFTRFVMNRSLQLSQTHMTTQQRKILLDFGRLALAAMKENRYFYTDAEIKSACQTSEITKWGFLLRSRSFFKGQKRDFFQPIHVAWSEYFSALYLASISHYSNILQREVFSLPLDGEPCLQTSAGIHRSALQVLFYLCSILGKKSYLFLNILSSFDFPAKTLLALLQTAGLSNANVIAVCKLIKGHAILPTSIAELSSWAALLEHPNCQLQSLVVQYERRTDGLMDSLFDSLSRNRSLNSLKLSAVIGQGLELCQILELSQQLSQILAKPKLQTLELSLSSVDEGIGSEVFQPLVTSLCHSIGESTITKLILDVDVNSKQVLELCQCISASGIQVLHLLHLCCEKDGLQSLAELLIRHNLSGLDLSGSWGGSFSPSDKHSNGAAHHCKSPSKESGIVTLGNSEVSITVTDCRDKTVAASPLTLNQSIGSLSSSSTSTPNSSTRTSVYLPLSSPASATATPHKEEESSTKQFLSLPRRTRGSRGYSSLTRGIVASSYLSRTDEKRRSDSMLFQKVLLPLPACDRSSHLQTGFHSVFDTLRQPHCRLSHLNLSKCSLTVADAMCLGESLRKNRTLISLRLEGLSGAREALPVVLALAENPTLQLLDLSSNHVIINDSAFQLLCRALSRNLCLQSLRLCSWNFSIEEEETLKSLSDAVQSTRLRELALSGCKIRIPLHGKSGPLSSALLGPILADDFVDLISRERDDQLRSDSLAFLKLDNCRLELSGKLTLRGPHLISFARGFQRLSELNLSLDDPSSSSSSASSAGQQGEFLKDKASIAFFQTLGQHCVVLRTLILHNWRFHWNKPEKTLKAIAKALRSSCLSHVSLDGVILETENSTLAGTFLATMFMTTLSNLSVLSLNYWRLSVEDAVDLGRCIRDKHCGTVLELGLKNVPAKIVRILIRTVEETGKITTSYINDHQYVYRFKKNGKVPSFLDKVMCITSWKE